MKKRGKTFLIILIMLPAVTICAHSIGISLALGQADPNVIGISMAYFIPRNGYFSNPIAPVSLRDIGVTFGRYIGLAGSFTFYSIGGMGLKDADNKVIEIPQGPVVGPFNSLMGSAVLKLILPIGNFEITGRGGIFGFYNIKPPLMRGNLDRYIASQESKSTVTSSFDYDGKLGWGWVFGGNFTYYIYGMFGISLGALYYLGGADMNFSGTWDGEVVTDQPLPSYLNDVKLDYSGLEIIVGASFKL